jgi:hypothetical protein
MHIIVDMHSLPGGVNFREFGKAEGYGDWFYSDSNLELSYQVLDEVIKFVQESGHVQSYTVASINEAVDNEDVRTFDTDAALSPKAADWVLQYFQGVIKRVAALNPNIPVMLQDSFKGEAYWAPKSPASANIVFGHHNLLFRWSRYGLAKSCSADNPGSEGSSGVRQVSCVRWGVEYTDGVR